MTRAAARELAVLICASMSPGEDPEEVAERFFEPEHYASMAQEGEQFAQRPKGKQAAYIRALTGRVAANLRELDELLDRYSHGWRVRRLSRTTAAILRCAVCEMRYVEDVPLSSAIDQAVELAKKYEGPETAAFVNGVLGGVARGEFAPEQGAGPDGTAPAEREQELAPEVPAEPVRDFAVAARDETGPAAGNSASGLFGREAADA